MTLAAAPARTPVPVPAPVAVETATADAPPADAADAGRVVAVVALAFGADPAMRALYPDPQQYLTYGPAFVRAFGGRAFDRGTVDYVAGYAGAALWLPPGVHADEDALGALLEESVAPPDRDEVNALFGQFETYHPRRRTGTCPSSASTPRGRGTATARRCSATPWRGATATARRPTWRPPVRAIARCTSGTGSRPSGRFRWGPGRPSGRCCAGPADRLRAGSLPYGPVGRSTHAPPAHARSAGAWATLCTGERLRGRRPEWAI